MPSVLNTDLGDLYNLWGERVAINEGFQPDDHWFDLIQVDDKV